MDKKEYAEKLASLIKKEKETTDKNELIKIKEELKKIRKEYHDSRFEEELDRIKKGMKNR